MLQCIKCNAEAVLFCIDPTDNKINIKKSKLFDCQVLKWPKYQYLEEFELKLENFNLVKDSTMSCDWAIPENIRTIPQTVFRNYKGKGGGPWTEYLKAWGDAWNSQAWRV